MTLTKRLPAWFSWPGGSHIGRIRRRPGRRRHDDYRPLPGERQHLHSLAQLVARAGSRKADRDRVRTGRPDDREHHEHGRDPGDVAHHSEADRSEGRRPGHPGRAFVRDLRSGDDRAGVGARVQRAIRALPTGHPLINNTIPGAGNTITLTPGTPGIRLSAVPGQAPLWLATRIIAAIES